MLASTSCDGWPQRCRYQSALLGGAMSMAVERGRATVALYCPLPLSLSRFHLSQKHWPF